MSFTDWFGRKGKNYTSTYKGSTRLGWDTKVSGSYSCLLYTSPSPRD